MFTSEVFSSGFVWITSLENRSKRARFDAATAATSRHACSFGERYEGFFGFGNWIHVAAGGDCRCPAWKSVKGDPRDWGLEQIYRRFGSCLVHDLGNGCCGSEAVQSTNLLYVCGNQLLRRTRRILTRLHQNAEQFVLNRRVHRTLT